VAAAPQPPLRSLLSRGYVGFTEATTPRHLVLPATTSVPVVVKLLDSPHRPPAFVMGADGASTVLEGDCAPSYLAVLLAPLGAYTLLGGLPMEELNGQLVDLVDVLGVAGRRLAEQLREAPSWRRRFALMDQFLLGRLERGPRPSPEVGWAWQRLVATPGAQQRLLEGVVGVVHRPEHPVAVRVQLGAVGRHQPPEGGPVAAAGRLQQRPLRRRAGLTHRARRRPRSRNYESRYYESR
jgi:hypothetical protein